MRNAEPVAVIMAGGEGKRFWPASSQGLPKQFLRLFGGESLIQETFRRLAGLVTSERVLVATGEAYRSLTLEHLPDLPPENVLCEPIPRNTAPALALAGLHIRRRFGDVPVLVLPADHFIQDTCEFQKAARNALETCRTADALVTFGIAPTRPETGYGYMELGPHDGGNLYGVARFVEKPPVEEAIHLFSSGRYLWNSGMFAWRNEVFLSELARYQPVLARAFASLESAMGTDAYAGRLRACLEDLPSISVDYAVMELSHRLRVLRVDFAWDDVGSWLALERLHPSDSRGNVALGEVTFLEDSTNCIVYGDGYPVGLLGVQDLVVAASDQGILVAGKEHVSGLKSFVDKLAGLRSSPSRKWRFGQPADVEPERVVLKPWGREVWWAVTRHYVGKVLEVKGGHALSRQYHEVKEETLFCLAGSGAVELAGRELVLSPGAVVHVSPGTVHRITAVTDLVLLEASTPHLDDVVRLEDQYGRVLKDGA